MSNVGELRAQSAYLNSDVSIEVIAPDPKSDLAAFLAKYEVIAVYPDTCNAKGEWKSCLKIVLAEKM